MLLLVALLAVVVVNFCQHENTIEIFRSVFNVVDFLGNGGGSCVGVRSVGIFGES